MIALACLVALGSAIAARPDVGPIGRDSTTVPIELLDGDRPIVSVTLNGRGPYRLAVETGSPDVLLAQQLVDSLRLPRDGSSASDSLFRLDSLRIGDVVVGALSVGQDAAFAPLGVDGVLGLDAYAGLS
jgi:hypothetical protein